MGGRPAMYGRLIKYLSTPLIWQLKWDQIKTNFLPQTYTIDVILKPMVKVFIRDV